MLVVRGGAIGDFVLTLPALHALRGSANQLAVLGPSAVAPLAVAGGLADEWRSLEGREWASWFVADDTCDPETAGWLSKFDTVISYLHDPDSVFECSIKKVKQLRYVTGPYKPSGQHITKTLAAPLQELGVIQFAELFRLEVPHVKLSWPGNWLAIHPGSGSEQKNWAEENWQNLIQRINTRTNWNILLTAGEVEA